VSWEVVAKQYNQAYIIARKHKVKGVEIEIPPEF